MQEVGSKSFMQDSPSSGAGTEQRGIQMWVNRANHGIFQPASEQTNLCLLPLLGSKELTYPQYKGHRIQPPCCGTRVVFMRACIWTTVETDSHARSRRYRI